MREEAWGLQSAPPRSLSLAGSLPWAAGSGTSLPAAPVQICPPGPGTLELGLSEGWSQPPQRLSCAHLWPSPRASPSRRVPGPAGVPLHASRAPSVEPTCRLCQGGLAHPRSHEWESGLVPAP